MATVKSFEDLEVWQLARAQAQQIFLLLKNIRNEKIFVAQINAAAGSVMDNIAEGFNRHSTKEFIQFLVIARGSNGEVQSQLFRALDHQIIGREEKESSIQRSQLIGRKLTALIKYLRNCNFKTKPI